MEFVLVFLFWFVVGGGRFCLITFGFGYVGYDGNMPTSVRVEDFVIVRLVVCCYFLDWRDGAKQVPRLGEPEGEARRRKTGSVGLDTLLAVVYERHDRTEVGIISLGPLEEIYPVGMVGFGKRNIRPYRSVSRLLSFLNTKLGDQLLCLLGPRNSQGCGWHLFLVWHVCSLFWVGASSVGVSLATSVHN